jgi:hypothetical protein
MIGNRGETCRDIETRAGAKGDESSSDDVRGGERELE